jgi:hypothetical protein
MLLLLSRGNQERMRARGILPRFSLPNFFGSRPDSKKLIFVITC